MADRPYLTETPAMKNLIKSSEGVGYFACLNDLSKWLLRATSSRGFDVLTLTALADELDRLSANKTARPVGAVAADVVSGLSPNGDACGRNSAQQHEDERRSISGQKLGEINEQGPALSAEPTPPLSPPWKDR